MSLLKPLLRPPYSKRTFNLSETSIVSLSITKLQYSFVDQLKVRTKPLSKSTIPHIRTQRILHSRSNTAMSSEPSTKKQRTQPPYELLYHPGVPGRGEHIRLVLEASNTPYTDVGNESKSSSSRVYKTCVNNSTESSDGNPPVFSPPALRVLGAGRGGEALVISQTPNILAYLGEKVGMAGEEGVEGSKWHVAQVALTALDLNNEVHDTHHPVRTLDTIPL